MTEPGSDGPGAVAAEPAEARPPRRTTMVVALGAVLAGILLVLLAGVLAGGSDTPVDPDFPVGERAQVQSDGTFVVTLDARDLEHWVPFDFGSGLLSPDPDRADVRVRRHSFQAPGGALALGEVTLEQARVPEGAEWRLDREIDGVVQSPALQRWYDYSYWTHLLSTRGEVYAVRRRAGGIAYLRVESYNCKPDGAGCVTSRYRLEG